MFPIFYRYPAMTCLKLGHGLSYRPLAFPKRFQRPLTATPSLGLASLATIASQSSSPTPSRPVLAASYPDNDLFNHTTGRWMYNEGKQLSSRFQYFDVEQLKRAACTALGATTCSKIEKIAEGFNKVFRLHFEGGKTAIARVPSQTLLGNAPAITASEVATMEFMRLHDSLIIPRVYASSSTFSNAVQSPYILMEDIAGVPMLHDWYEIRGDPVGKALHTFANDIKRMSIPVFSQIGSIYFKEDLPLDLQSRPLFRNDLYEDDLIERFQPAVDKFRVGPIADRLWWRTMHDDIDADRGPWNDISDMLLAAVRLEERAIHKYKANPSLLSSTYTNSLQELEHVEQLLQKAALLAPSISGALRQHSFAGDHLADNVAVHANLNAGNIMVPRDDGENTVTRFKNLTYIDWQGTSILPLVLQLDIPALVEYNGALLKVPFDFRDEIPWPEGMDQLSEADQDFVRAHHRLASRERAYKSIFVPGFAPFAATHSHCLYPFVSQLPTRILRAVADGPVLLRECLIGFYERWDEEECHGPCPISFTDDEIKLHMVELDVRENYNCNREKITTAMGADIDGKVDNANYARAQMVMKATRAQWDPPRCGGPFPLDEGKWSFFLT
ncbi:protein kinase subdomain-containing protein PKL/CAK/Fmp29 [Pholiota conissans]|uniref:Altered inheritance of mitochondria protein 9, mitochondrial n=1 Tax=Pholiota conissans TaxID=109636 RepID=A0A9P5YP30_9AGAR|nr:protein kinase subdomain-containing protein PKL/CAK/Fmp29 [Pholiota conissans]